MSCTCTVKLARPDPTPSASSRRRLVAAAAPTAAPKGALIRAWGLAMLARTLPPGRLRRRRRAGRFLVGIAEHHGPGLSAVATAGLEFRVVHPGLLGPLVALGGHVSLGDAFVADKLARGEAVDLVRGGFVGRDLGCRFRNHPVVATAWDFVGADLDEAAALDG